MPPRPSMHKTKYHESYYYSDRKALLLDKRGERNAYPHDARRCGAPSISCDNQPSATPISHSLPEPAILCSCGWEMSEPLSF